MVKRFVVGASLALLGALPASAAVYLTSDGTVGNQAWSGTLGLDFHVGTPIQITSLGVFDSGRDGITTNVTAGIFNSSGGLLGQAINFNGVANLLGSAYVYQSVAPIMLGIGDYQIGAWNYNGTDMNYNSMGGASDVTFDTFGGSLTALGSRYANPNSGGILATNPDVGATRYGAGTFVAETVPAGARPTPPSIPPVTQSAGIYFGPDNITANQAWTGTLGLDFTVGRSIKISSLGIFDADRNGIAGNLYTGIFNAAGTLVSPVVNFNGAGNAGNDAYIFQSVNSFTLAPGSYQLASWGFDGANGNYNSEGGPSSIGFRSLNGAITATGSRYADSGIAGVLATNIDNGAMRYGAGSFLAAVPEPTTWVLYLAGFGAIGLMSRRRRPDLLAA